MWGPRTIPSTVVFLTNTELCSPAEGSRNNVLSQLLQTGEKPYTWWLLNLFVLKRLRQYRRKSPSVKPEMPSNKKKAHCKIIYWQMLFLGVTLKCFEKKLAVTGHNHATKSFKHKLVTFWQGSHARATACLQIWHAALKIGLWGWVWQYTQYTGKLTFYILCVWIEVLPFSILIQMIMTYTVFTVKYSSTLKSFCFLYFLSCGSW